MLNSPCITDRSNPDLHGVQIGTIGAVAIPNILSNLIVGGSIHVVDSLNPTNERWIGKAVCSAPATGMICLYKATLICSPAVQPATYSLTKLLSKDLIFATNSDVVCWDIDEIFGYALAKGDLIVPVIGVNGGEATSISYTTSLRLKQS